MFEPRRHGARFVFSLRRALLVFAAISLAVMNLPAAAQTSDPDVTPTALSISEESATPMLTPSPTATFVIKATASPRPTFTPTPTPVSVGRVTAIGDSVMLGAAREMRRSIANIEVDAQVSRQANAAIKLAQTRLAAGTLGEVVVVHIGNNGPITTTQFDQLMQPLKSARLVVVINLRVPRRWEAGNNQILADGVKRYSNAVLVDWNGYVRSNPCLIGNDGIHLGAKGARLYSELVVNVLRLDVPTVPMAPTPSPTSLMWE